MKACTGALRTWVSRPRDGVLSLTAAACVLMAPGSASASSVYGVQCVEVSQGYTTTLNRSICLATNDTALFVTYWSDPSMSIGAKGSVLTVDQVTPTGMLLTFDIDALVSASAQSGDGGWSQSSGQVFVGPSLSSNKGGVMTLFGEVTTIGEAAVTGGIRGIAGTTVTSPYELSQPVRHMTLGAPDLAYAVEGADKKAFLISAGAGYAPDGSLSSVSARFNRVEVRIGTVPESASVVLMALGLLGIGVVARKSKH